MPKGRVPFLVLATLWGLSRLSAQATAPVKHTPNFPSYSVRDLGTLGGTFSFAGGINDRGDVEGFSTVPGDVATHAFLWRNGTMHDLATLGGPNSWAGFRPSNAGLVGGVSEAPILDPRTPCDDFGNSLACPAVMWHEGVLVPLQLLGGNSGEANGFNSRGQVVGAAENSSDDPGCNLHRQIQPVIWKKDGKIQSILPFLSGDSRGDANAINDRSEVVGWSGDCIFHAHAVLWRDGVVTDLGTFGGVQSTVAGDINNKTQVVGWSDLPGDDVSHAFLWENGTMKDLGTLPGDFISFGDGINNNGQVVGDSCMGGDFADCRPFLWQDGVKVDLNSLIPSDSPLYLIDATGTINSRGQIAGLAIQISSGEIHAFLATPCDHDDQKCAGGGIASLAAVERTVRPDLHLTENVRMQLRQGVARRRDIHSKP